MCNFVHLTIILGIYLSQWNLVLGKQPSSMQYKINEEASICTWFLHPGTGGTAIGICFLNLLPFPS